jgi:hypothetical protein
MSDLKHGDAVKVWPMPGKRVQRHPETFGQFMAADGEDVQFSDWIHDRLMDGSVSLHDPRPAPTAPARVEAAHAAPAKKDGEK